MVASAPPAIIVMGPSGAGKTTIGRQLAGQLGWPFFDADDFHSTKNRAKMAAGQPLTDDDRLPWLLSLRDLLLSHSPPAQAAVRKSPAAQAAVRQSPAGHAAVRQQQQRQLPCESSGDHDGSEARDHDGSEARDHDGSEARDHDGIKATHTATGRSNNGLEGESSTVSGCVLACSALKPEYRDILRGRHMGCGELAEGQPGGQGETVHRDREQEGGLSMNSRQQQEGAQQVPAGRSGKRCWSEPAGTSSIASEGISEGGTCPLFVVLDVPRAVLLLRVASRAAEGRHFMPASLVDSQVGLLRVGEEERDVISVDGTQEMEYVVQQILQHLPRSFIS